MSTVLDRVEHEALSLPDSERAFLADRLLSSLCGDALSDVDTVWVAEAERRYHDYKSGKRTPIPASQVFEDADRLLK
jgi:putative addiction module component (TIGR02574 family)